MNERIFDWVLRPDYVDEIPHVHFRKTGTFSGADAEDETYFFVLCFLQFGHQQRLYGHVG
jgi:hypothetical protein